MSTNNLTVVFQLRCSECDEPIRIADTGKRHGFHEYAFEHIGEPCRRYYGEDSGKHPGFPVENPYPARRCAACWPYGTREEVGEGRKDDPRGIVTIHREPWGDCTACATCTRSNWHSIGD